MVVDKLKTIRGDVEYLQMDIDRLKKRIDRLTEHINEVVGEELKDILKYAITDFTELMAVGEWPYQYEDEITIKLKTGEFKYKEVSKDDIFFGDRFVIVGNTKVVKSYFEDAIRILCALLHEKYNKKVYKRPAFAFYASRKDLPVFIEAHGTIFVAITPYVDEGEEYEEV